MSRAIAKRSCWVIRGSKEGAKRQCCVAVNISYFPCLFSRADIEHHGVQPESLSYYSKLKWLLLPKSKLPLSKLKDEHFFSIGELFISGLSDREARKLSRARGAKRRSSARNANARATPGWTASLFS